MISQVLSSSHRLRSQFKASVFVWAAVLLSFLAIDASAAQGPAIATELSAMKIVRETDARGVEKEALAPVTTILPGEQVLYSLKYRNDGAEPVTGLVITLPMPADMLLAPESAEKTGTTVTYSIDGGASFDRLDHLSVTTPEGLVRPANPGDVTAIRWTVAATLQPTQEGTVGCVASVK